MCWPMSVVWLLDLNVCYKAAHGQQSNPRNALLSLITFSASKNRKQGQGYEQTEAGCDLEM